MKHHLNGISQNNNLHTMNDKKEYPKLSYKHLAMSY